jgi:hypothetical protein
MPPHRQPSPANTSPIDIGCSSHALTTPLVLHTNCNRGLRELLLRLGLAVRLVLLAHCLSTDVFFLVTEMLLAKCFSVHKLGKNVLSCGHAVVGLHV